MSELAIMAIISVVSSMINYAATNAQQKKEMTQQEALQEDAQQFQVEREDIMFGRNSYKGQMQQMLDAGFNPMLAANALLGGNGVVAASSDASPTAPTTNSAIQALSQMIGQGGQSLYDAMKNQAEIHNIQADTDKKEVETGIMPRDFQLRQLSTIKQLEVWDASIKRTAAAQHLDEAQTDLIRQQNLYYGRMAEAQISAYQSQVAKAYADASLSLEQINTEKSKQRELDTQAGLNVAQTEVAHAETILLGTQNSTEYYKSESARIAQEFEKKLGDIPLTADGQKYVQKLAKDGDLDGIKNFYSNILQTAANQQFGSDLGSSGHFGLPFNVFQGRPNTELNGFMSGYKNAPLWNMIQQ